MDSIFVSLRPHQLHRLAGPVGVRAESGDLWVTVDGEPEDIVLAAGESHCVPRPGAVVMAYALGGAASFEARSAGAHRGERGAHLGERFVRWLRSARPVWGGGT